MGCRSASHSSSPAIAASPGRTLAQSNAIFAQSINGMVKFAIRANKAGDLSDENTRKYLGYLGNLSYISLQIAEIQTAGAQSAQQSSRIWGMIQDLAPKAYFEQVGIPEKMKPFALAVDFSLEQIRKQVHP